MWVYLIQLLIYCRLFVGGIIFFNYSNCNYKQLMVIVMQNEYKGAIYIITHKLRNINVYQVLNVMHYNNNLLIDFIINFVDELTVP